MEAMPSGLRRLWIVDNQNDHFPGPAVSAMDEERFTAQEVVRRLGGSATWNQILRHSTNHSIRTALASGELRKLVRGTYALPELEAADQAAAATHGLVSHISAAEHWKLQLLNPPDLTHITVPRLARPRPRRHVQLHFSDVPGVDDHNGVTSPLRTVLDCAVSLPFNEALAIADSALRLGLITEEELIMAAHDRRGRRGARRMNRVARAADGRAANPFESACGPL